jgi:putative peptidoglycan lipid II flippase
MNPSIRQAIIGVSGIAILSKIVGFLREMVIADRFGTSHEYDIFLLAISAPVFFQMVAMRATNFLTVPILARMNSSQDGDSNKRNIWSMFNSLFTIIFLLLIAVIVFAPYLVKLMASDLTPENFSLGIFYCRIFSLAILLSFLEAFLRSMLNVKKSFAYPAMGIIILNIVTIICIYLFSGKFSVSAILMGTILGMAMQVIFLLLKLWDIKALKYFNLDIFSGQVKQALKVGGIIVGVELLMVTFFLVDRYFAADLGEGVVSAIKYAGVLVMLPGNIIGFAIAAVTFPYLSERAGEESHQEFSSLLHSSLSLALIIGLPTGIFFFVFPRELIAAVFLRGAFDMNSLVMTARILKAFAPYLVCLFLYAILIQACYSAGRQKMVFWITLLAVALKYFLTWLFKNIFDYPGIALATSVVYILIASLMILFLVRQNLLADIKKLLITVFRVVIASVPILILAFFAGMSLQLPAHPSFWFKMRIIPIAAISILLFIAISYIINISEIKTFIRGLRRTSQ